MKKNIIDENKSLYFIGFFVLLLMFLLSWANRLEGRFQPQVVVLHSLLTCRELDTQLRPIGESKLFDAQSRQVCLWLRYSGARDGDQLHIVWTYNSERIHKESIYLKENEGVRVFYLVRADGAPLSKGTYSVSVQPNREKPQTINFQVLSKK